jgi:hypothetical protein
MLREIQIKGFKEVYYRFIMILPKQFLGRGRTFSDISGKGEEFDRTTSWYRDDCKIPMSYVTGVELHIILEDKAYLSFLIDNKDIGKFVKEMSKALKDFNFDVKIEEYKNDDTITVSRGT